LHLVIIMAITTTTAVVGFASGYLLARRRAMNAAVPAPQRRRNFESVFSVVSYNILADGLYAAVGAHAESPHGGFNTYSTPAERAWSRRFPLIMSELDSLSPDVICLQEVQQEKHGSFKRALAARGYTTTLSKAGASEHDLNLMVAVRNNCFNIVNSAVVRLSDEAANVEDLDEDFRKQIEGKEAELLLVLLEHRETNRRLVVATTHLFWDPAFSDVKCFQASLVARGLVKWLRRWGHPANSSAPVVLAGGAS
jgi:CCR4-NOT transcription complex subunit 6